MSASIGENPGAVINGDYAGPLRIAEKQLPGGISPSGDEQDRLPSGSEPLERGGFGGGVIGGSPAGPSEDGSGKTPRPLESGEVDEGREERKNDGYPALKRGRSGFIPPARLTRRIAMTISVSTTFWGDFRVGGKLTTP